MDEQTLIHSARLGEAGAWQALMQRHHEPVFRFAYLLLNDPDDADDIAQETFIRAYQAIDRFDVSRRFRPWLFSITANAARNRQRSFNRYSAAIKNWWQQKDHAPSPVEVLTGRQLEAQILWQAVRRLRRSDQVVIYLRYFLEMPVAEAAESLDLKPGTVKSRLSRAINRLRDVIRDEFPELEFEG